MFVKTVYLYDKTFMGTLKKQFPKVSGAKMERTEFYTTIDITTVCNLACANCQRASHLKAYAVAMSMDDIKAFIYEHEHLGKRLTVKLLGGEPTMHPYIEEIIDIMLEYFHVGIVTNGTTRWHNRRNIWCEDTDKTPHENPMFYTTFDAPVDDSLYDGQDYSLGCRTAEHCGNCVTVDGHYPCNVGGTIDRLLFDGANAGTLINVNFEGYRKNFFKKMCQYCGVFKFTGYKSQPRPPMINEEVRSKTFQFLDGKSIHEQLNDNIDRPERHNINPANRPPRSLDPLSPRNLNKDK